MGRIIAGFFVTLLGAGLLWGAWALSQRTLDFKANAVATTGEVIDFERETSTSDGKRKTMYRPVVRFTTENGQAIEFAGGTSSSSPSYERGEQVKVLYRKGTPEDARIDSFMENWLGPLIVGLFGLIAAPLGTWLFLGGIRNKRVRAWLAQHGQTIQAPLGGVEQNTSYAVNGKHPWRLTAQWQNPRDGRIHVFHSDNLWYDPSGYINRDTIAVRINPEDPTQYHMDIDFLPKKA